MHLYALATHKSYTKSCLISNLLVSASSSTISISKVNDESAKLQTLVSKNMFATITALIPISASSFALLSDAGGVAILSYERRTLTSTLANFMRSGIRTVSPVYGACDPQGRILLIAALESQRLAYILGIGGELNGPIDCSQKEVILYDLCALNVGYANPIFCQIERRRGGVRLLAFYEFDLGLNLLRRNQSMVCPDAHLLIALPESFPGVLVCRTNFIEYFTPVSTRPHIYIAFPGRAISGAVHEVGSSTFALIQAEDGKIYKLTFTRNPDLDPEVELKLCYFNAAPPATALHIFKAGFLYLSSATQDHKLYQFLSLGEDQPTLAFGQCDEHKCNAIKPIPEGGEPENLEETDYLLGLNALTCSRLGSARSKTQNSVVVGNGAQIRTLRFAIEVEELVSSPLPQPAVRIFVTGGVPSKLIVVCFEEDILTLRVEDQVTQVKDTGLVAAKTLGVEEMSGVLVQVHAKGVRQVGKATKDWTAPRRIVACALNASQALVALEDNSLLYFEFVNGALQKVSTQTLDSEVGCLALQQTPVGSARANYAAIGLKDTLRICSVDTELQLVGIQNLSAPAVSIVISKSCQMHVGLQNGVYMQSRIDSASGSLLSTKSRLLGTKPVSVCSAWAAEDEREGVVAISNQSWLTWPGANFDMTPLSVGVVSVAKFSTEDTPQALAGIVGGELKIFSIESTRNRYSALSSVALSAVPTRFAQVQGTLWALMPHAVHANGREHALPAGLVGLRHANCRFESRRKDFLVVSALGNMRYEKFEQKYDQALLLVYEYRDDGGLELVHSTNTGEPVYALLGFKGMLLAGVGGKLVMYEIGLKQLLRKKSLEVGTKIVELAYNRNRVFAADSRRSVTVLVYGEEDGFMVVADDPVARAVSSMAVLDPDTVVIGDRFGTLSVLRVPSAASELSADPAMLPLLAAKPGYLNGAHYKLEVVASYHLGDVVSGLHIGIFAPGAFESIMWCGVQGNMGVLVSATESEAKFFASLEGELRAGASMVGRSHLGYRGYSAPPKNIVDGELCETFGELDASTKQAIAARLGSDPESIEARVAEFRVRCTSVGAPL